MDRLLLRLGIGLLMALFGLFSYCTNVVTNPVTGEKQRVQLSPQQEVVLGQKSSQQMAGQHGGLYQDSALQTYVTQVGQRIVDKSKASQAPSANAHYPFKFYLLRDPQTINAFALPGGPVFITVGLLRRLKSEAQLAGVLGHEIAHVVARHGAEHLAKQQLGASLVNAVGVAASDNPDSARQAALLAQAVNQMVSLRYGREDELESDQLGFQFITQAGYNPLGIVELMQILGASRSTKQGGSAPPEFFSTHPNPENRVERLKQLIAQAYPNGIPTNLEEGRDKFTKSVLPRLQRQS
ncbi:MAG: M48 family metallopeptidase [Cyanobacteriota bacterium]|nr:M48 family metallopeptidase [Cyanobacteriota bacterium]